MKRQQTNLLKRAYIRPDIKRAAAITEYGTLADHFSGGTDDESMLIEEEEDTSDEQPRAHKYSVWDYNIWY